MNESLANIENLVRDSVAQAGELLRAGLFKHAEELCRQVLRVTPDNPDAMSLLGLSLSASGSHDEAIKVISEAIEIRPNDYRLYNNLGLVTSKIGDATRHFAAAHELNPGESCVIINMALEVEKWGGDCEPFYEKACSLNCPHAYFNYGAYHYSKRNFCRAKELYLKSLEINPDMHIARYNLANCQMFLGEEEEAWENFESRWLARPHLAKIRNYLKLPYWNGSRSDLVLFIEQGQGDFVQFARYIPWAVENNNKVYICCDELVWPLVKGLADRYTGQKAEACCSVMSLPKFCKEEMPPLKLNYPAPYGWEAYDKFFKVGLCWSGSHLHPNDLSRSIHLSMFGNLTSIPGTKWFGMSKPGRRFREGKTYSWEEGANVKIVGLYDSMKDFGDMAAAVSMLDLIVTVDTAAAHVAGSMNKETWLLLPYLPDWRWGINSDRTKHYPSVKIYRQERPGDWHSVLMQVFLDLNRRKK